MSKLTMLIGLPGCGKSSFAEDIVNKTCYNVNVYSSDKLRKELWGDENTQGDNVVLFQELHERVRNSLINGEDCIYDATNLNSKRRISFLNSLKDIDCYKECVVFIVDIDKCTERNNNRDRVVPEDVIKRMYLNIDIPQYREGWDNIICKFEKQEDKNYDILSVLDNLKAIPHDNPHHLLSIGDHMLAVASDIKSKYSATFASDIERLNRLLMAALCHDIGKEYTKTFKNNKGEDTEVAHYFNHEHVSAYMFMLMVCDTMETKDLLYIADLIQLHMRMFDNNAVKKLKKELDRKEFEDLCILHESDINCS